MNFRTYLIRRLVATAFTFWGVVTLVFVIARIVPGEPAAVIAGTKATTEKIAQIRVQYGLDKPIYEQYVDFILDIVLRWDLGMSFATERPVTAELALRFPATLELTSLSILIAVSVGVPLGVIAAVYRDELPDHISRVLAISSISFPAFWVAILAQLLFFYHLGWLPGDGRLPTNMAPPPRTTGMFLVDSVIHRQLDVFLAALKHLVMPAAVLSLGTMALTMRIVRSSMIETLNNDYITWSKAHGFGDMTIYFKHALRNAMMPAITAVGLSFGLMLGGAVIIEIIFNIRGIGLFLYKAILGSDFNGIVGVTIVFSLAYLLINLFVDILHTYVNPEVEVGG